jgi:hypothetical protein
LDIWWQQQKCFAGRRVRPQSRQNKTRKIRKEKSKEIDCTLLFRKIKHVIENKRSWKENHNGVEETKYQT